MNSPGQKLDSTPRRRRYVIHLYCAQEESSNARRYIARIQPWTARGSFRAKFRERSFTDECELIETINPLLPPGSDVRDVLSHIESTDGFLYLLHLNLEEAGRLGWQSTE
jgi:hypothetical protein